MQCPMAHVMAMLCMPCMPFEPYGWKSFHPNKIYPMINRLLLTYVAKISWFWHHIDPSNGKINFSPTSAHLGLPIYFATHITQHAAKFDPRNSRILRPGRTAWPKNTKHSDSDKWRADTNIQTTYTGNLAQNNIFTCRHVENKNKLQKYVYFTSFKQPTSKCWLSIRV